MFWNLPLASIWSLGIHRGYHCLVPIPTMLLAGLMLPPCVQQKGPFFTWGLCELAHIPLCRRTGQFHGSSLLFEVDGENFSPFPTPVFVWSYPSMVYQLVLVWLFLNSWLSCFNWLQQQETIQIEDLSEAVFCNYVREDSPQGICPSLAQGKQQKQRAGSRERAEGRQKCMCALLVPVHWPRLSLWGMTRS